MTEGSYTYKHGFKDDYVFPSINAVKRIAEKNKMSTDEDAWMVNNILRMIVHEGLYDEAAGDGEQEENVDTIEKRW